MQQLGISDSATARNPQPAVTSNLATTQESSDPGRGRESQPETKSFPANSRALQILTCKLFDIKILPTFSRHRDDSMRHPGGGIYLKEAPKPQANQAAKRGQERGHKKSCQPLQKEAATED